jgi:hypothetical protein
MASKKTAWQNAKDLIVDYAINDLDKNYGIKATASQIAPKAHRDSPDHVLFFTEEFKGAQVQSWQLWQVSVFVSA